MKYIVETPKSAEQAVADLQAAIQRHKFGVLHIHNLQETLKRKGVDFPKCLSDPRNMQPSKGQRGSDRGYGPEYGVAMPCLRLFRGRQNKDRHDEAIRDAESAFRFPSLGPRSAGGGGDDHRNDRRSQVGLSLEMVIRAREPGMHRETSRPR